MHGLTSVELVPQHGVQIRPLDERRRRHGGVQLIQAVHQIRVVEQFRGGGGGRTVRRRRWRR